MFYFREHGIYILGKYNGIGAYVKSTHGLQPPTPVLHPCPHFCWTLRAILIYKSLNPTSYTNYQMQRKLMKCIPKLVCSEVSALN